MDIEIPSPNRLDIIKRTLRNLQGQSIHIRANLGRSRVVERKGRLVAAHPAVFVVDLEERRGRVSRQSYQYVDVLTGSVEVSDVLTGEPLF